MKPWNTKLLHFPSRDAALAWGAIALACGWPLGLGLLRARAATDAWLAGWVSPPEYTWQSQDYGGIGVFLSLQDPWIYTLTALGALAVVLVCSHGLALALDVLYARLARGGLALRARGVTFELALALTLAGALAWLLGFELSGRTDANGLPLAVTGEQAGRLDAAWPELRAAFEAGFPLSDRALGKQPGNFGQGEVAWPVGAPEPALRALAGYQGVAIAYFISPQGRLSYLDRSGLYGQGEHSGTIELASWRPKVWSRSWLVDDSTLETRRENAREAMIGELVYGAGNDQAPFSSWPRFPLVQHAHPATWFMRRFESHDGPFTWFERLDPARGRLGYGTGAMRGPLLFSGVLARHGLGQGLVDSIVDPVWGQRRFGANTQALDDPGADSHVRLQALVGLDATSNVVARYQLNRIALLMACLLPLVASLFEVLRQLRAMWTERALVLAQSNFLSAVSHEMRTPLATIKLYAELGLDERAGTPLERAGFMQTIVAECDRLGRLVENVLDYARLGQGKWRYHREAVEAGEVLDAALLAVSGAALAAGISLEREVLDTPPLTADRDALVQALVNLLGNALRHAPAGPVVRAIARPAPGGVEFLVQDQGPGIPAAERERIFKPFYRLGSELRRTTTGSGLGLALVKAHIEAHGGRVEVVARDEPGACFRIFLPASPAPVSLAPPQEQHP